MKIEYITIDAGQRFDAVMPEIPTNSIINKTVTGCGATYAEINAPRHSVIIEPNVPVIEGKMKKHPQILGVFEGVTTEDIIDFLNTNYNDGYLKIMTTPESFPKVRSAMVQTHTDMHGEWFMLFDECEARYRMQATAARSRSRWMIFSDANKRRWFPQRRSFRPIPVSSSRALQ